MTALYREPWFTDLAHLTDGRGYTVYAASRARADERGGVLPRSDLHLVFGPLPVRARHDVQQALLALGLWSEVAGGFGVHHPLSTNASTTERSLLETPPPTSASAPTIVASKFERVQRRRDSDRRRQQTCRQRKHAESLLSKDRATCERGGHGNEAPVTPPVTVPVTLRSRTEGDFSLSPSFKMNPGEGEERTSPRASELVTVTSSKAAPVAVGDSTPLRGPADNPLASALPQATAEAPSAAREVEPQVVAWWSQATNRPASDATPSDLAAVRRCAAEGATLTDFHAAIAFASVDAWYQALGNDGLPRHRLAVVCGKRFRELVRKGMSGRPGLASVAPPTAVAVRPEPPDGTLRRRYQGDHPAFVGVDRESPHVWAGYVWMWSYASARWEMQGRNPNAQKVA